MSYWVRLTEEDIPVTVDPHTEGGVYVMGGDTSAELNVTYNYSTLYAAYGFSLRDLHGKRAGDMVPTLEAIVGHLGHTQHSRNYWAPTAGNAGHALNVLLRWAQANPNAMFLVS